jgi:hypothetical protein
MKKFNEGDKYLQALEAKYTSNLSDLRKEFTVEENGKKVLDKESYIAKIKSSLTPKIEVTTQELEELAMKRISSIKEYLLKEHAIDDKRLFINDKITVVDNKNAKYAEFALAIDIKKK